MREKKFAQKLEEIATLMGDSSPAIRFIQMAKCLCELLTDEEFLLACREVIKNENRLPAPNKFLEYAKSSKKEEAQIAFEKVMRAIRRFNDMDGQGAREYIDDDTAWRAVSSFGGWFSLVTQSNFNQMVFRSQFLAAYESFGIFTERADKLRLSDSPLAGLIEKLIKPV